MKHKKELVPPAGTEVSHTTQKEEILKERRCKRVYLSTLKHPEEVLVYIHRVYEKGFTRYVDATRKVQKEISVGRKIKINHMMQVNISTITSIRKLGSKRHLFKKS